jgi:hypothetical protein
MSARSEPIADSPAPGPTYAAAVEGRKKMLAITNIAIESTEKIFKVVSPFTFQDSLSHLTSINKKNA